MASVDPGDLSSPPFNYKQVLIEREGIGMSSSLLLYEDCCWGRSTRTREAAQSPCRPIRGH